MTNRNDESMSNLEQLASAVERSDSRLTATADTYQNKSGSRPMGIRVSLRTEPRESAFLVVDVDSLSSSSVDLVNELISRFWERRDERREDILDTLRGAAYFCQTSDELQIINDAIADLRALWETIDNTQ